MRKNPDPFQMRVVEQAFNIVQRHDRNIRGIEQRNPVGRGAGFQDIGDEFVNFIDMRGAIAVRREIAESCRRSSRSMARKKFFQCVSV